MSFYKDKRVAVLGGAGMIGSELVELLLEEGARVFVLDDFSRGRQGNLPLDNPRLTVVWANLIRGFYLETELEDGIDIVFNFAAKVTGMHYNKDHHSEMFCKNMQLMTTPLASAVQYGVTHFLQASTVCVYPHNMAYPVREDEGHTGNPEPTNAGYGWAKRMGERYAQWVAQEYDIKIGITRFSNCFGPRDYFDDATSHVIPALIKRTVENDIVSIYGSGSTIREFLYSRDAAIGAMKVLEHYPEADAVNIGNPENRISIIDLAKLIQEVCGVTKTIYNIMNKYPEGYPKRGSDIRKLKEKTGWQPQTSLRDGLESAIKWYLDNREVA